MGVQRVPVSEAKLLDQVRETMHTSRYSPRTEAAYVDWIKRYFRFRGIRHSQEKDQPHKTLDISLRSFGKSFLLSISPRQRGCPHLHSSNSSPSSKS